MMTETARNAMRATHSVAQ